MMLFFDLNFEIDDGGNLDNSQQGHDNLKRHVFCLVTEEDHAAKTTEGSVEEAEEKQHGFGYAATLVVCQVLVPSKEQESKDAWRCQQV